MMHRIRRKKWISTLAAGAMLSAQLAMPLYGAAQETNNDASFRKNLIGGGLLNNPIQIPPAALRLFDPFDRSNATRTPIKHVILIIGENRTFDHVFATYTPPAGQSVSNLLSKGIVTTTGALGTNAGLATQWQASETGLFSPSPTKTTAFRRAPRSRPRCRSPWFARGHR